MTGNKATLDGGGIYNSSSDEFLVIDSTMQRNTALDGGGFANAPDADLIIRQSSILGNIARMPGLDDGGLRLDGGEGGGFWSKADGDALIENTTISGNKAAISGGGIFHDADGELQALQRHDLAQLGALSAAASASSSPTSSPEVPPKANESVILRNTIVGGSLAGGSCDWYVTSEGGNVAGGSVPQVPTPGLLRTTSRSRSINGCFPIRRPARSDSTIEGLRDRLGNAAPRRARRQRRADADATRRGARASPSTPRMLPVPRDRPARRRAPAERASATPAPTSTRATPPDADDVPPDTEYLSGPIQDTLETIAFTFTGTDNQTADRRAPVRVPARRARAHRGARADRAVGAGPARAPVGAVREPVVRSR